MNVTGVLPVHFKKYMEYIEKHHNTLIQIWTFGFVFNCSAIFIFLFIFFLQVDKSYLNYSPYFLMGGRSKGFERISTLWWGLLENHQKHSYIPLLYFTSKSLW